MKSKKKFLFESTISLYFIDDKFSAIFKELQYVCFLNHNFVGNIISENNRRHFSNQRFEISSLNVYSFSLFGGFSGPLLSNKTTVKI